MTIASKNSNPRNWEQVAQEWLLECEKLRSSLRRIKEIVRAESSIRLRTKAERDIWNNIPDDI